MESARVQQRPEDVICTLCVPTNTRGIDAALTAARRRPPTSGPGRRAVLGSDRPLPGPPRGNGHEDVDATEGTAAPIYDRLMTERGDVVADAARGAEQTRREAAGVLGFGGLETNNGHEGSS